MIIISTEGTGEEPLVYAITLVSDVEAALAAFQNGGGAATMPSRGYISSALAYQWPDWLSAPARHTSMVTG